jgi:hypothetical protein
MLYPTDHPEFGSALALAVRACRDLLDVLPVCTLHHDRSGLYLMGEPCPPGNSSDRFAARLRDRDIPAITFREGVTKEELLALLQLLRSEPELVVEQGGGAVWLRQCGAQHISLEPASASPSRQMEWESFLLTQESSDRDALERLMALCSGPDCSCPHEDGAADGEPILAWLAGVLGATARVIPKDSSARADWLQRVALALRKLSPALQAKLFRVRVASELDMLSEVACLLPPEEAVGILVSCPNAVATEASEQLAVVLTRLLPTEERARKVEPLAKAALLSRGMTEESYQSIVSPIVRRTLFSAPRAADQRQAGGRQRVSLLTDLVAGVSARSMRDHHVDVLLELVVSPGETSGREQLVRVLVELIAVSLAECDGDRALNLLRRAHEAIAAGGLCPADRKLLRACLKRACSRDLSQQLAGAMVRAPSPGNVFILRLLSSAETGFGALLRVAKETPLRWLQAAAGAAIVRMGRRSHDPCFVKLTLGQPEEAVSLVRCLVLSGLQEGFARASWALEHPDPRVVVGLMEVLAHAPGDRAEPVLSRGLHDRRPEVQCAAAKSLGSHPSVEAVTALRALLADRIACRRAGVARSAVAALGQIGGDEAVAVLHALLRRRHVFLRRHMRELRALATQALATMADAAAEQVLVIEARDGAPDVAALCQQALDSRRSTRSAEVLHGPHS